MKGGAQAGQGREDGTATEIAATGRGREDEIAAAGRGREDETATEIAVDTTTAIATGPTSDGGTMGTGIEETMMGAEGIDMPIRKTNDL